MSRTVTPRRRNIRHSLGVSLAARGAGAHVYRDENSAEGGQAVLRRRVRRTGKHALRRALAAGELH